MSPLGGSVVVVVVVLVVVLVVVVDEVDDVDIAAADVVVKSVAPALVHETNPTETTTTRNLETGDTKRQGYEGHRPTWSLVLDTQYWIPQGTKCPIRQIL